MQIAVTRATLCHLIQRHGGNRTAIGASIGRSMNTVRRLIAEHGLDADADDAAVATGRSGPREASDEAMQLERERLLCALSQGPRTAAVELRWSIASVYRKRRMYEITTEELAQMSTKPPVK